MTTSTGTDAHQGRCAALAEAASTLTSDELLDLAERFQREIDTAVAMRTIALAHLSAREPRLLEDGTEVEEHRGLGHQRMDAPELAAPRLGVSVHKATQLIMTAVDQLTRTPQVVTALASGELNEAKASAVTHETMFLPADSAREVAERAADHWADLTVGPLRTRVATIAAEVDPDAVAAHVNDVRSRRGLTRRTGSDGTDHWRADLLTEHARPAWAAVTERALQIRRDGDAETMEQARADALTQLILEHSDVTVVIHATRAATTTTPEPPEPDAPEPPEPNADLDADADAGAESESSQPALGAAPALQTTVSCPNGHDITAQHLVSEHLATTDSATTDTAMTATGATGTAAMRRGDSEEVSRLVEVGGFGAPGTTFVPAAFLAGATTAASDDPATQLTCHPDTGALLSGYVPASLAPTRTKNANSSDAESSAYRVPAAMARLVRLRDGTCRFPGCTASARQTDLDHVIPWPQGPTHPGNLIALCRHHHRIKQRHDWRVRLDPDGTATWTDPTGREFTTHPVDHLRLATVHPSTPETENTSDTTTSEQPSTLETLLDDLLDTDRRTPHGRHAHRRYAARNCRTYDHRGQPLFHDTRTDLHNGLLKGRTVLVDLPPPTPEPETIPF